MAKLGSIYSAVWALGLPMLASACNIGTESQSPVETTVQHPLQAATPSRPDVNTTPTAHQLLAPDPGLSDAEVRQRAFDGLEADFHKSWVEGAADYVVEGTIISADAVVIPNVTSHGKRQLISTHYRVAPTRSWGKAVPSEPDFWVIGGSLPPEIADSAGLPRSSRYSHEAYPALGDTILVAIKLQPFPTGNQVPRPVWNGASVLSTNGSSALPADVTTKARERLNANFSQ